MMMRVVFPILVCLLCVQLAHTSELSIEECYDKIDEHLTKAVGSEDVEISMQEAAKWLWKLDQKRQKIFTMHRGLNWSLIKALNSLISLKNLLNSKACNDESLMIIRSNDKASRMDRRLVKHPNRRIEKIVYYHAKKHYELCYPDIVSQSFALLDADTQKRLLEIGRSSSVTALDCIRLLREQVVDVNDKTELAKHQAARDEFEKYLVACKELEREMGDNFDECKSREFKHYDIDMEQYHKILNKRGAVKFCQSIMRFESQIYRVMSESSEEKTFDYHPDSVAIESASDAGSKDESSDISGGLMLANTFYDSYGEFDGGDGGMSFSEREFRLSQIGSE